MVYEASKDRLLRLLKDMDEIIAVSGYEDEIRNFIADELKPFSNELWTDSLGNLIAVRRGLGEGKVMIAAHMDEIGLMVKHISKDGFIRFAPVGGWTPIILPGQRVLIKTSKGDIVKGVVGSKPPHIMKPEEAKQVIPLEDLFIDVGASSRGEVNGLGITIGSPIVIDRDVATLRGDVITGRAFDNKVGVAVMIEAFKSINDFKFDVYAVATAEEEVGLKGARVAAYSISPDIGLALDTTVASDIPGVDESKHITRIGKGPAIKVMDGRSGAGIIASPIIRRKLIEVAEKLKIPYQLELLTGGTTDASIIQLTRDGVPTGAVSIPTRYIHSPIETLSLSDALNAVKLVKGFIESLSREWVAKALKVRIK